MLDSHPKYGRFRDRPVLGYFLLLQNNKILLRILILLVKEIGQVRLRFLTGPPSKITGLGKNIICIFLLAGVNSELAVLRESPAAALVFQTLDGSRIVEQRLEYCSVTRSACSACAIK